jgi:deazaflavin-dependent oxidoreductase (nitroreductase family)
VPLLYLMDDNAPIVIASWGGRPNHPEWFENLTADPSVEVQIRGRRFAATATPMAEPDRSVWWNRAVKAHDGYAEYQARTDRVIPVIRLEPNDQ